MIPDFLNQPGLLGLLIHLSPLIAGIAWFAWQCLTAPMGWEDEDGYHDGEPPRNVIPFRPRPVRERGSECPAEVRHRL